MEHTPVMRAQVQALLALRPGQTYVDGTLGLAGHALAFAPDLAPEGLIVGLDWDESMLALARERLASVQGVVVRTVHADYRELPRALTDVARETGRAPVAHGILLDLGLNSAQIDDPSRGISFQAEGPLDMRMDRTAGEPAAAWINRASEDEIDKVLRTYGDERWSRQIARVVVDRRKSTPLRTTGDLVNVIDAAVPPSRRDRRIHFATRSFQAIRVFINRELDDLSEAIEGAARVLAPAGTLVVLAYHSGEDRVVKTVFRRLGTEPDYEALFRKPLTPSDDEVARNPRSRSARLRALRRHDSSATDLQGPLP